MQSVRGGMAACEVKSGTQMKGQKRAFDCASTSLAATYRSVDSHPWCLDFGAGHSPCSETTGLRDRQYLESRMNVLEASVASGASWFLSPMVGIGVPLSVKPDSRVELG